MKLCTVQCRPKDPFDFAQGRPCSTILVYTIHKTALATAPILLYDLWPFGKCEYIKKGHVREDEYQGVGSFSHWSDGWLARQGVNQFPGAGIAQVFSCFFFNGLGVCS